MSNAKREKDARRGYGPRPDPFAWLPPGLLVSRVVCRLSGGTLAVFLLLNANWKPAANGRERGRAVLPYGKATAQCRIGRTALARAFRELEEAGLIVRLTFGTRPRGPGGARAKAAEWALPFRERGTHPKLPLPANMRRPEGAILWNVHLIRHDVVRLTRSALKVLVYAVGHLDRTRNGGVADDAPFELPSQTNLASRWGVPTRRSRNWSPAVVSRSLCRVPAAVRRITRSLSATPVIGAACSLPIWSCRIQSPSPSPEHEPISPVLPPNATT
jgi:hypothetical protein